MRKTLITLLFGLYACNNESDQNATDQKVETVHVDTFFIDTNEIHGGEPYKEYYIDKK